MAGKGRVSSYLLIDPLKGVDIYAAPVPEIIDPVYTKTGPKRSFCMTENERFGLVFTKTGSINSGTDVVSNTDRNVVQYFMY
jgi:hypothetical protein